MPQPPPPHPRGARPPAIPRELVPQPRRAGHGRQRALGQRARAAADRGAPARRGVADGRRPRLHRHRRAVALGLRVLHRELAAQPRRGALPHGLQPRRHPPPGRRDARDGRAGALGRAAAAAVAQRDPRAGDRRGEDEAQRRAQPDHVRQLRRPGRDRRRGPADRPPRRGGPDQARTRSTSGSIARHLDEPDMPDVDLFVRSSGEQRTSNFLLWQSRVRRDGLPRHALPRLRPPPPLAGRRDLRPARPPLRRRAGQAHGAPR